MEQNPKKGPDLLRLLLFQVGTDLKQSWNMEQKMAFFAHFLYTNCKRDVFLYIRNVNSKMVAQILLFCPCNMFVTFEDPTQILLSYFFVLSILFEKFTCFYQLACAII